VETEHWGCENSKKNVSTHLREQHELMDPVSALARRLQRRHQRVRHGVHVGVRQPDVLVQQRRLQPRLKKRATKSTPRQS